MQLCLQGQVHGSSPHYAMGNTQDNLDPFPKETGAWARNEVSNAFFWPTCHFDWLQ
jgi:hypothetical protein